MKIRKDQRLMTAVEWDNFVCAFRELKEGFLKGVAKPSLDDFADEHAAAFKDKNHDWKVHSHFKDGQWHRGPHFLAWHRVFLNAFENRLRREVPSVTIPYWNAFKDPFPEALKKISDNEGKRVPFPPNELQSLLPSGARDVLLPRIPELEARVVFETRELEVVSDARLSGSPVHARVTVLLARAGDEAVVTWRQVE